LNRKLEDVKNCITGEKINPKKKQQLTDSQKYIMNVDDISTNRYWVEGLHKLIPHKTLNTTTA
jgi:hypothetical protein